MFDLTAYGKLVSFETYAANILGDTYKSVKLLSIVDFETARLFGDVANIAISVYPSLPVGTPKDYKKYHYAKVQHSSGDVICIALPWINNDTIRYHTNVVATVKIQLNDIETLDKLRRILAANNLTPLEITVD